MWSLLLVLCLSADAGVPPGGVELKVWRAATELPPGWRLPANFDFATEQLASSASGGNNVSIVVRRFERSGGDLYVSAPSAPRVRRCPPCRGINTLDRSLDFVEVSAAMPPTPIYRLPRTSGRVFELRPLELVEPSSCPPCLAP